MSSSWPLPPLASHDFGFLEEIILPVRLDIPIQWIAWRLHIILQDILGFPLNTRH